MNSGLIKDFAVLAFLMSGTMGIACLMNWALKCSERPWRRPSPGPPARTNPLETGDGGGAAFERLRVERVLVPVDFSACTGATGPMSTGHAG